MINRNIIKNLLSSLKTSPIVFLNGPRQAGKSTLVRYLAKNQFPARYISFDDLTQMAAAASSPQSYLEENTAPLIIDEVQLVPEIFRALKITIDELRLQQKTKLTGQFLLTGSANIMALPQLSNPLVGRMNILTLYPVCGAEIAGSEGDFIDRIFKNVFHKSLGKYQLLDMIKLATFPEISGAKSNHYNKWFEAYLTTIMQRDVRSLAEISKIGALPNLLRILANRAGGLINDADIARDAGLVHMTARNYKILLKSLFLTFEIAPWYRNIGKRLVKAPKGYIIDTMLLCHLIGYELSDLKEKRPELFGHIVENFVATELLKLIANDGQNVQIFHFRSSDNKEIDFVLQKPDGKLCAIEVKARDRLDKSDFKHLQFLQKTTNQDFISGIILYLGKEVVPFGKNLWAVPISNLWS